MMWKKITLVCMLALCGWTPLTFAQDTVDIEGLEFTEIQSDSVVSTNDNDTNVQNLIERKEASAAVETDHQKRSLWGIFLAGLVGGMAALLMPCIFPMLPLTVSYFTKGSAKGKAFTRATLYGLFIILIYVILGLVITVLFGADALNSLSTDGIFNFVFFLLLVVFAASFLGAFEITLPSSWVNKMDSKSDKGGMELQ